MSPNLNITRTPMTHLPETAFELSDEDLRIVSAAAMSCETALGVSKGYFAMYQLLNAVGMTSLGFYYAGQSVGVLQGAC